MSKNKQTNKQMREINFILKCEGFKNMSIVSWFQTHLYAGCCHCLLLSLMLPELLKFWVTQWLTNSDFFKLDVVFFGVRKLLFAK